MLTPVLMTMTMTEVQHRISSGTDPIRNRRSPGKDLVSVTITVPGRYRRSPNVPTRRGDPIAEFEQLQEQMSQIISSFLRGEQNLGVAAQAPFWVPAADLEETDDAYVLELELPGVRKDDVNIEVRDNELRVTGEIKQKERTGILRRQMRRVGQFQYVVALPGDIDPEQVEASLHDGVLTVRLGKAAASQPRQIEVRES
ncbi:heat shock protein Hsp20 [Krasilnikovia cinnamomea]|uniref:Heat shock protein Hsp20 n=1 Tax=Krasilnikovia cinnamomea TaxID=349313 RepID=A0A4Q7ZRM2_9ACTN|nr:Hsp20/alpha crystallin family protein [Krasilnikovia cinnamomea]RZU53484.1 heat shock protein Hsp20 [Krasilnikovia cinnamomea]